MLFRSSRGYVHVERDFAGWEAVCRGKRAASADPLRALKAIGLPRHEAARLAQIIADVTGIHHPASAARRTS